MRQPCRHARGNSSDAASMYSAAAAGKIWTGASPLGPSFNPASGSNSCSTACSSASVNLPPAGPKNFIPLSPAGLWDAVITTPNAAPWVRTARDTAGVGMTPRLTATMPSVASPFANAASRIGPDSRVSRPISTRGAAPGDFSVAVRFIQRPTAAPRRRANVALITGPP